MKTIKILSLASLALLCSSCLTRIITTAVAPEPTTVTYTQPTTRVVYESTYVQRPTSTTTVVKTTPSKTTTTVVQVTPLNEDISFFLDLRAVAAAFAEANTLEDFERLLNSSNYMLSSLDLNHDGYVDYLRVVEAMDGYNHVVIIQAVLAQNIFQDVATLTVEMSYSTPYVQVIGAPYIYGPNYYVRPVFVRTPPMFARWRAHGYTPWHSPYYWDYYPHYYHKPAPIYLSHYQAYVNTYISNHKYCNRCEYDDRVHYSDYGRTSSTVTRKDFETRHPEQNFSSRISAASRAAQSSGNTGSTSTTRTPINNARDLQQRVASNTTTTTNSGSTGRTSSTTARTSGTSGSTSTSRTSGTSSSSRTSSSTSSSRTSGSTSSSSTTSSSPARKATPASTTTNSRVSSNGAARTTSRTVNTDGTSTTTRRGESSTSRTSSTSSRTSGTSGSSRTSSSTTKSRNSSSSSSSSRTSGTSSSSRTSSQTRK